MPSIISSFLISSRSLRFAAQAAAATLLLSCGGGGGGGGAYTTPPPPPPPPTNTFNVGGTDGGYGETLTFSPATMTVTAGSTVTWVWRGNGHSLYSGAGCSADNAFSSGGTQNTGFTLTHTFNTPGSYPFFCGVHCGSNMKGTITVQ
jgi:plastocyanin